MNKNKHKMKKTTIELTEEHFFLKEKSLVLQRQRKRYSIVSIIRDLVKKDQDEWRKKNPKN